MRILKWKGDYKFIKKEKYWNIVFKENNIEYMYLLDLI